MFHADGGRDGRTDRHDEANRHFFFAILRKRLKWTVPVRIYFGLFFAVLSSFCETRSSSDVGGSGMI